MLRGKENEYTLLGSIILTLLKQTHISFSKTALTFIAKLMQRKTNTLLVHFCLLLGPFINFIYRYTYLTSYKLSANVNLGENKT